MGELEAQAGKKPLPIKLQYAKGEAKKKKKKKKKRICLILIIELAFILVLGLIIFSLIFFPCVLEHLTFALYITVSMLQGLFCPLLPI